MTLSGVKYVTKAIVVHLFPLPNANWDALKKVADIVSQINNKLQSLNIKQVKVVSYKVDKNKKEIIFYVKYPNIVESSIMSDIFLICVVIAVILLTLGFIVQNITTSNVEISQNEIKKKALELYSKGKITKQELNKIVTTTNTTSNHTTSDTISNLIDVLLIFLLVPIVIEILMDLLPKLREVSK